MKEKIRDLKNYILPILFSISISYWSMSSLFGLPIVEILIIIILVNIVLFTGYIFLKDSVKKGIIAFIVFNAIFFLGIGSMIITSSSLYNVNYFEWILISNPENIQYIPEFWYGTVLLASYGFSFTVFYFTSIRFRMIIILLVGIIPFLLQSAKTTMQISFPFLIFLILFFLLYIDKIRRENSKGSKCTNKGFDIWYLGVMMVFVTIIVLFSVSLPKPKTIPKLAQLDNVIGQAIEPFGATVQNIIQERNEVLNVFNPTSNRTSSHISALTAPVTGNILFEVVAQEPLYFKIQSWDRYEKNKWTIGDVSLSHPLDMEINNLRLMKTDVIISLIERINSDDNILTGLNNVINNTRYDLVSQKEREAVIISKHYTYNVFLTPPGVTNVHLVDDRTVYTNEYGYCFLMIGEKPYNNDMYAVDYISRELPDRSVQWQVLLELNKEIVDNILSYDRYVIEEYEDVDLEDHKNSDVVIVNINEEMVLTEAKKEMEIAYNNYLDLPDDLPQRIHVLAESIVRGKEADYEKALAINNYFHNQGYEYDLSPPNLLGNKDYIDFFIFESKKGICTHFASAMVILARAAGLPARYVEGYVADEIDYETDRYIIRGKDAHAFPEVFIAGYGWMVFEPTVSNESNNEFMIFLLNAVDAIKNITSYLLALFINMPLWIKLILIPYIFFVLFMFIRVFVRVRYSIWENKLNKTNRAKAIEEIFENTERVLRKINLEIQIYETPSSYAHRIFNEKGIDIHDIVSSFNKSKYGGIEPTDEDVKNGLVIYNQIKSYIKKDVGRFKAVFV
ncbi:UNVERIFIED_CONTAM: Transglutaminase-like enzymes, putative cysteine proteases [Acetivibrio alkalicellulosi]